MDMALTLVAMPEFAFTARSFELRRSLATSKQRNGRIETQELGAPKWVGQWTTRPKDVIGAGKWQAFWDQLRGGGRGFLGFDPWRPFPASYPTGALGFSGQASIVTITNPNQMTISGLPTGFILLQGDYMEVRQANDVRSLHRISADVTVAGATAAVTFEPWLNTDVFTTAAIINFVRPSCIMLPDPNSWAFAPEPGTPAPITFGGEQRVI
jgi:hypothetical protein